MSIDRNNPFPAVLKESYRLNKAGSSKETWHVVLGIEGSRLCYRPGDSVAICPQNDPKIVRQIIDRIGATGSEIIVDQKSGTRFSLQHWLLHRCNLTSFSHKLLHYLLHYASDHKEEIAFLLQPEGGDVCREFLETHDVAEALEKYAVTGGSFEMFIRSLQPLLPRYYSIASSQNVVGDEIHLTVARVQYEVAGKKRVGTCSHFLCDLLQREPGVVPLYMHPTKEFLLPDDHSVPIIMIGPGTGIAPYRAFMQQRQHYRQSTEKNWLFFGERNREHDFFYEDFWSSLVDQGMLELDPAFSRDTSDKVYVQHRMWEKRTQLWQWIERGAVLYVCGDAKNMARDVDQTIRQVIECVGGIAPDAAKGYLHHLKSTKRYLRDVY